MEFFFFDEFCDMFTLKFFEMPHEFNFETFDLILYLLKRRRSNVSVKMDFREVALKYVLHH
jgi:hypothetical protein